MWLITSDVNPAHLSEIVLIRLLHHAVHFSWLLILCSYSPFFTMLCFSLNSPHLRSGELCFTPLRAKHLHKLFGIFLFIFYKYKIYISNYLLNLSLVQVKIDFQDRFRSWKSRAKKEVASHCTCILVSLNRLTQQTLPSFPLLGDSWRSGHYMAGCISTKGPARYEEVPWFRWSFCTSRILFSLQKSVTDFLPCHLLVLFLISFWASL